MPDEVKSFLRQVVDARITGTGMHLTERERYATIGYSEHPVRGLKTLVRDMIDHVVETLLEHRPEEKGLNDSRSLEPGLAVLCEEFLVDPGLYAAELAQLRGEPAVWGSLGPYEKAAFYLNAFFTAFEETRVALAHAAIHIAANLFGRGRVEVPELRAHEFAFLFRAREYALVFSERVYNRGFATTVGRIGHLLSGVYQQHRAGTPPDAAGHTGHSLGRQTPNDAPLSAETQRLLESVVEADVHAGIARALEHQEVGAVPLLKRLFAHPDEGLQMAAFEAIAVLGGEDLAELDLAPLEMD
jgi:hypothetical protein